MLSNKGSILSNDLEFPSSNLPWLNQGADISFVESKSGKILMEDIFKNINNKTKTILTSHVQYSTGFKQDLIELGRLAREKGLFLVVNSTQSIGALRFDVEDFNVDFMASSGHKWMLSSYGIGTIYVKKEHLQDFDAFKPPFFSHLGQKNKHTFENKRLDMSCTASRFELGSPHFPNIFALNAATKYILKIGIGEIEKRILSLTQYLIEKLQEIKLYILSPLEDKYRSGIIVFRADNATTIARKLKKDMIIVSVRGGGIRVSPHFYNNEEDIDKLISALKSY
jgi:selenocysteine lyase/cysteine desulfurase